MTKFKKFVDEAKTNELRIVISAKEDFVEAFGQQLLTETKQSTVGRYTAYKHQPHFQGGEYHGVCNTGGGCEVSWTISGKRHHPGKFPSEIPKDARMAVAKVLGVDAKKFESFKAYDEVEGKEVLLLELREENGIEQRLKRLFGRMR